MVQLPAQHVFSGDEVMRLRHPWEDSRYTIAVITSLVVLAFTLYVVIASAGAFLFILAIVVFSVWFALQMLQARLIGNAVRVSPYNFPELYAVLESIKKRLDYRDPVDMYVVEAGELNAFLYRLFRARFIVLNSELVTAMTQQQDLTQLTWIIARFVGALKTKHLRLEYIRILISALEQVQIFNLFLLPYERATQYTGDQIGLAVCEDVGQAQLAMLKFVVGKDLAHRVSPPGFIDQAAAIRGSFFGWYSQILSSHPHWTSRYLNQLAFARFKFRPAFDQYLGTLGMDPRHVDGVLPQYFPYIATAPVVVNTPPRQWGQ